MIGPNKKYNIVDYLMILITFTMIITGINIILISEDIFIAKADNETTVEVFKQNANENESFRENLFIYIFNKSFTLFELSSKENKVIDSSSLFKHVLNKVVNFDYKNPKSYLGAQLSMIKEVEKEIDVALKNSEEKGTEDYDTSQIFIPEEYSNEHVIIDEEDQHLKKKADRDDDIVAINVNGFQDDNDETENVSMQKNDRSNINIDIALEDEIEIISTPVPPPKKIEHSKDKPLILIFHTHGTESYKPEVKGNYHSLNREFTVIKVGEVLTKYLTDKGYNVVHDTTLHDYPSYQGSYKRSLKTMNRNIKNNPDIKIFIDIHRDAFERIDEIENKQKNKYNEIRKNSYIEINGEKVARFALVVGGGNNNVNELKKFAYYIKAISDELYPGLARPVLVKSKNYNRYNQFISNYCTLIEIGNNVNTIDEAVRSAQYIGEIIDKALRGFVDMN